MTFVFYLAYIYKEMEGDVKAKKRIIGKQPDQERQETVSYTHLTLPTIYSV